MASNEDPHQDDLTDSPSDQERLKPEKATIDLPGVSDIPGQEHVHIPPLGELADTTASSADEEDVLNGDSLDDDDPNKEDNDDPAENSSTDDTPTVGIP